MTHPHTVVWLDHQSARLISFSPDTSDTTEVHSSQVGRLHTKSGVPGSGHAADDHSFFDQIAAELADAPAVLIAGPGTAKKAFEQHLQRRHPQIAQRVFGVETMDHPTDGELLDHARRFFKRIDQLGLDGHP
jgi:stalled ribosome rescue protein Dom34